MTDQTTEAMRTAMRQLADMAPAAPDLPSVEHHARGRRPVAAFAAGFALVLVVGGVGAVLVAQTTDESHDASAISPPTSATDLETTPTFETTPTLETTSTTAVQQNAGSFVVYGSDNGVEDG
ncbi:MAG: hypothetical protein MUQ27_10095, partial [Acidimicrobiia bacterium]|nr:hypothetical protein [Acidimicrobiia bacterium]